MRAATGCRGFRPAGVASRFAYRLLQHSPAARTYDFRPARGPAAQFPFLPGEQGAKRRLLERNHSPHPVSRPVPFFPQAANPVRDAHRPGARVPRIGRRYCQRHGHATDCLVAYARRSPLRLQHLPPGNRGGSEILPASAANRTATWAGERFGCGTLNQIAARETAAFRRTRLASLLILAPPQARRSPVFPNRPRSISEAHWTYAPFPTKIGRHSDSLLHLRKFHFSGARNCGTGARELCCNCKKGKYNSWKEHRIAMIDASRRVA